MQNANLIPIAGDPGVVTFTMRSNGVLIPSSLEVLAILVCREVNRIPTAKIVVSDGDPAAQDFEISNQPWFVPGSELEVFLGNLNGESLLFKGTVVNQQISVRRGASRLEIDCRAAIYQMTLRRNSRYFENLTDQAMATELLNNYKIPHLVAKTKHKHQRLVQYDTSDWDFLIMRMDFNGLLTIVENEQVRIATPDFEQKPVLRLEYGSTVLEFDGKLEVRDQFQSIQTRSWSHRDQNIVDLAAEEPDLIPNGNLPGPEMARANGVASNIHRHGGQVVEGEMQAWANARLLKDRLSRTRGRVQFRGFNDIQPGQLVELGGFGNRFNGPVYVAGVRQEFYEGTWLTDIEFGLSTKWFSQTVKVEAPPAAGMLAPVCGLQIGVVTQIENDPDGAHRIQISLPIIDKEAAGVWARLATLDAGGGRGTFFLPEVKDEVIVGFINDDPRDAVVLGMLHSSAKPPPFTASKDNFEKGLVTRKGLKFIFHEEEQSITLETPGKNRIVLSDKGQGLLLQDQFGNSIALGKTGIVINSEKKLTITAKEDIETKTDKDWHTKANKKVFLEGVKKTDIKGKTVNIN